MHHPGVHEHSVTSIDCHQLRLILPIIRVPRPQHSRLVKFAEEGLVCSWPDVGGTHVLGDVLQGDEGGEDAPGIPIELHVRMNILSLGTRMRRYYAKLDKGGAPPEHTDVCLGCRFGGMQYCFEQPPVARSHAQSQVVPALPIVYPCETLFIALAYRCVELRRKPRLGSFHRVGGEHAAQDNEAVLLQLHLQRINLAFISVCRTTPVA
mmetsp:Transcript_18730/g.35355  ORF Transcript_18730/g.35355 Transcript_18730/m.35355 type:complete len:208 (-) Transcript_18730:206-829(-)|eukprot:CAMPEP_0170169916 /NCGR_PEP_ID=MMETSP0040_2-20121228/2861_1 /TAXON_ID=641309 /ORGANISM="Lotharella oceanica, Strain CCMP622" /LENGTH=207 /DNA_ID=CAMNT_0010408951 /DNA_START=282 /DNA_END=905 /DNA_ORIENTATION=+